MCTIVQIHSYSITLGKIQSQFFLFFGCRSLVYHVQLLSLHPHMWAVMQLCTIHAYHAILIHAVLIKQMEISVAEPVLF